MQSPGIQAGRIFANPGRDGWVDEIVAFANTGGGFYSIGGYRREMTSDERLRLARRRESQLLWFDNRTVAETGFETLDENLWSPLISAESASDPELALERMGLLAPDENRSMRATVAGVLLCCESPERFFPDARILAARYRGEDRASGQIDAQTIGGPVSAQITKSVAFVLRNMKVAARKDPARVDMPQYSERVIFEAVVNAVAHRDYSIQGSATRISVFEDRVEILSPGSPPNDIPVDGMHLRQSARNEILTSILGRMPVGNAKGVRERRFFMERRGGGVPIIRRETRELCGRLPEYRLVDESELCLTIPAASLELTPASPVITVRHDGRPLAGADVLVLFPNGTWKHAVTDENGEATVSLHSTHLPMTVFVAAQGFAAHVERDWVPAQRPLAVELDALSEGGSIIFTESTGHVPGLAGRLNPILDTLDRTYLYASNIAVEEGRQQPVHFVFGQDLLLTDSDGGEKVVRIVEILGSSSILEYRDKARGGEK